MKGSTIARRGKPSVKPPTRRAPDKVDIGKAFEEGTLIDRAVRKGVREAMHRHKQAGVPVATMKDGKVVLVKL